MGGHALANSQCERDDDERAPGPIAQPNLAPSNWSEEFDAPVGADPPINVTLRNARSRYKVKGAKREKARQGFLKKILFILCVHELCRRSWKVQMRADGRCKRLI
jgi:hypothetical protein